MSESPKVVTMEPKDEFKAAMAQLARQAPDIADSVKHIARIRRASYLAHLDQGFTEAQALELCKSMAL